jgi:hypothetical protein
VIYTSINAIRSVPYDGDAIFRCGDCGAEKPVFNNYQTNYFYLSGTDVPLCADCSANHQKQTMINTGKACLYLVFNPNEVPDFNPQIHCCNHGWSVIDVSGKLRFKASVHKGRHNIARTRYDVWFRGPDGWWWYGVTYGDNTQICHCRRTKQKI